MAQVFEAKIAKKERMMKFRRSLVKKHRLFKSKFSRKVLASTASSIISLE